MDIETIGRLLVRQQEKHEEAREKRLEALARRRAKPKVDRHAGCKARYRALKRKHKAELKAIFQRYNRRVSRVHYVRRPCLKCGWCGQTRKYLPVDSPKLRFAMIEWRALVRAGIVESFPDELLLPDEMDYFKAAPVRDGRNYHQ